MITLEEIKDEYATEKGYSDWCSLYKEHVFRIGEFENRMNEVAKRYAKEVAMEALKNASENATFNKETQYTGGFGITGLLYEESLVIDKQSIINESNIPKL